jgi:hypothetical protein
VPTAQSALEEIMAKVTVTFKMKLTKVSIFDDVKGEFCEDAHGVLKDRSFDVGDISEFPCKREEEDPYAVKIRIEGENPDKTKIYESYDLEDSSNNIDFPKSSLIDRIMAHPEFQKLADRIAAGSDRNK